ncbi:(Fe-S)-binding protein [Thermodesulfobacteriota bacterium]
MSLMPGHFPANLLIALLFFGALGVFAYVVYNLYRILRLGTNEDRFDRIVERIKSVIVFVFGQKRVVREPSGLGHFVIFWGFIFITIGTVESLAKGISETFSYKLVFEAIAEPLGWLYGPLNLAQDFFSLAVLVAIIVAFHRRYILKPDRLKTDDPHARVDATIILSLIFVLVIFMFLTRGLEMNRFQEIPGGWAPISAFCAALFKGMSMGSQDVLRGLFWWIHNLIILAFLIYIPFSKHLHLLGAIPNIFFRSFKSKGELPKMDLEDETVETYGVSKIEEYTWKQLLDEYACTECGRCQDNCPANLTDKPLSPSILIHHLKTHLLEKGKVMIQSAEDGDAVEDPSGALEKNLIGDVIQDDEIWACTTCRACMEACPVFIEHIQKIVDLRRNLVLMESRFPQEVQSVFKNMETNYNPWSMGYASRADWASGLDVPTLADKGEAEYIYWVGCAGSFDDRSKKVSTDMVKILKAAGVDFAILGTEEMCCGETARRMGNEYLAQTLMQGNAEILNNYGVKKIITACPHCFNTLKNEYAQFDGNYELIHHTEFIWDLLKSGAIKLDGSVEGTIAYHDSCYLGRYNDIYEAPRNIVKAFKGSKHVEMDRIKEKSFCCGAGGGRMWMEETLGERINEVRTDAAIEAGASTVATACPYCLTMFEDGVKARNKVESMKVLDIAELVAGSL